MPLSTADYGFELGYEGNVHSSDLNTELAGTLQGYVNGETSPLPFGRVVFDLNGDGRCRSTLVAGSVGVGLLGVTVSSDRFEHIAGQPQGAYPLRETVCVMRKGVILMRAETSVTRNQTLWRYRFSPDLSNPFNAIGRIRPDVGAVVGTQPLPSQWFKALDSASPGQIFRLEVRIPQFSIA